MDAPVQPSHTIELRVDHLAHLFDPLDPFPTPTRDLSRTAEDFIVGWARELPENAALSIVIYLGEETGEGAAAGVCEAMRRHFTARAEHVRGDINELFRVGRTSLLIGLVVLAGCILASTLASRLFGAAPLARFFTEGLIILGWVANWRPIEIFLYDWWPLAKQRKLFERIAAASIDVRAAAERRV